MTHETKTHKNYDTVFKEALLLYRNKTFDFLGLDLAAVDKPVHTEMTEVTINKNFTDMGFILKDKTGLHAEWEAEISSDDMLRFCIYNVNYTRTYKTKFTTVIFTNKNQRISCFENDMIRFTPHVINLGERDGDRLLEKIKTQIKNGEPVNELELVYLPLYHSKYKNTAEMLEQVIELAPRVSEMKLDNEKIMLMSAVLANKFISEEEYQKILEAIRMYVEELTFVKLLTREAEEKGKAGIIISMLNKGLDVDTIAEYTDMPIDEIQMIKDTL